MTRAVEQPLGGPDRPVAAAGRAGTTPVQLPARRDVFAWAWAIVRPYVGWVLALLGGLALFLGWYGVSGEALTAKQLPYLVSGGLTGIGLVILGSVFLATDDVRRQLARVHELEQKIDDLYALLTEDAPAADGRSGAAAHEVLALPAGSSYHLPTCALVSGKADARPVDRARIRARSLRPCRVCEPGPVS